MNLPPYDLFPSLSNDRILLRQVLTSDVEEIIEISFYDCIQAKTLQEAIEMQGKIDKDYFDGNSVQWCIVDKSTNKIVGTCGYCRGFNKGAGELGCVLLTQYKRQGFMKTALELAIEFGINNIGLKRIWALTTKENNSAIKLLSGLNFIKIAELEDDFIEYQLL